ncbi:hypothetical protein BT93_C2398 [Corymbia citriodora subsp. variegata]|nr:hypothetical protein BT93_C2398 [Corymbia citriodora subsp. variegata]
MVFNAIADWSSRMLVGDSFLILECARDLQRDLENKANDLSKLQKGKCSNNLFVFIYVIGNIIMAYDTLTANEISTDFAKNHQVRKKYTIQLGENELVLKELDLLNEDVNVSKLIGPVLVKQDLAEANANVHKRIDYISAELKRLDATLQDLEEKQNAKRDMILKLQQRIQSLQAGKAKA